MQDFSPNFTINKSIMCIVYKTKKINKYIDIFKSTAVATKNESNNI